MQYRIIYIKIFVFIKVNSNKKDITEFFVLIRKIEYMAILIYCSYQLHRVLMAVDMQAYDSNRSKGKPQKNRQTKSSHT